MPRIENTIAIRGKPADVFAATNEIERWPELFPEYRDARILDIDDGGRYVAINFVLTNNEGSSWRSWRLLDKENMFAIATRVDPMYPFNFMHLNWTYAHDGAFTRMTWMQDFELDPKVEIPISQVIENMNTHTQKNQERIKLTLES